MKVQFRICDDGLVFPKTQLAFKAADNNFLIARVRLTAGLQKGKRMLFKGELPSCAPYFKFETLCTISEKPEARSQLLELKQRRNAKVTIERLQPTGVKRSDVQFMAKELQTLGLVKEAQRLTEFASTFSIDSNDPKPDAEMLEYPGIKDCIEQVRRCDIFRKEREQPLRELFSKKSNRGYSPEQDAKIQQLSEQDLAELEQMCTKQPWLLCFRKWSHGRFKLAPMPIGNYQHHVRTLRMSIAPLVDMAVKTHARLVAVRQKGHTLFTLDAMRIQDDNVRTGVFRYLKFKAIRPMPNDQTLFSFLQDYDDAETIVNRLVAVYHHPKLPQPRLGSKVPCIADQPLSDEQRAFTETLIGPREAPISLLQGGPGTGKSYVGLEWLLQHYSSPLILTYTAMMVNAGQQRMGKRPETMHTIHYVIHVARTKPYAKKWLEQFDVLVIDEASNVDTHLLAKLFRALPDESLCKIVMIGDLGQIYPISPGCPYRDMISVFPQHATVLTENKRVNQASRILADTARLVNDGYSDRVDYTSDSEVLSLMQRSADDIENIVRAWCQVRTDIMQVQFIVLRNQDRRSINKRVETALLGAGLIDKSPALKLNATCTLYVGQKITFTKNLTPSNGDAVRNGELGQVFKFSRSARTGAITITLTNGKSICVHSELGVPPHTVNLGYASTCNKAQGSEWERACFYMYSGCDEDTWWCRSYSYVAVSRAKKQCIILGTRNEFIELGKRAQPQRYTVLNYLLRRQQALGSFDSHQISTRKTPAIDKKVSLLDSSVLAVPALSQFAPDKKKKKTKRKKKKRQKKE
jgi:hypothetical protein